jgi:hypothetical protein
MAPSNVYAMLDGRKKLTWKTIEKLISNATLEADCQIRICLNTTCGINAELAQSQKTVAPTSYEERVEFEEEQ